MTILRHTESAPLKQSAVSQHITPSGRHGLGTAKKYEWWEKYDPQKSVLSRKNYLTIKRVMDVTVIILAMPIIGLVLAVCALLIKLESPKGPILFKQLRTGKGGRRFEMYKFRTMFETNFLRGDDPRFRPRQMIRFLRPFEFEPRLSLVAWDEFFVRVNSTQWGGQAGFDQNRAFLGLGWSFVPGVRAELGYMNQYIEDAKYVNQTENNLIMGSLFVGW